MLATIMRDESVFTPPSSWLSPLPHPLPFNPWLAPEEKSRLYRFVATFGICVTIIVLNSALNVLQLAFVSCLP